MMKPFDAAGAELDAIFTIEPVADGARLILESRGGGKAGPRPPRNADYASGLELLLRRLGNAGATLNDVEVFSERTKSLPPDQRRISAPSFALPLKLEALADVTAFRLELGRASAALGRVSGNAAGGNSTKRLRLTLKWPSAVGQTAAHLESLLAGTARPIKEGSSRLAYAALGDYLRVQKKPKIRLGLSQIANLIGRPLPDEARTHQFWANAAGYQRARRRQWLAAGYKAQYEKRTETVVFTRSADPVELERPTDDPELFRARVKAAKDKLARRGSVEPPVGSSIVTKTAATVTRYVRDPEVVAWVLGEANGKCEVCEKAAPFTDQDGLPFLEVHHVRPLGDGGPDQVDNAIAVCPNCHRHLHHGIDRDGVRARVIAKVARLKSYPFK